MRFGQCPYCVVRYDGDFFYYCLLNRREVGKSHRCLNPSMRRERSGGKV